MKYLANINKIPGPCDHEKMNHVVNLMVLIVQA